MNLKIFALLLFFSFWLASCQQPSQPADKSRMTDIDLNDMTRIDAFDNQYKIDGDVDWDAARVIALNIVEGNCQKVEKTKIDNLDVFVVRIIRPNNTVVNIYITVKTATVLKVESDSNDDVNLNPKKEYKNLKQAIKLALDALKKYDVNVVIHWEITYDRKDSWHYTIKIKTSKKGTVTIKIKAKDGSVINIKDDKDNDLSHGYYTGDTQVSKDVNVLPNPYPAKK